MARSPQGPERTPGPLQVGDVLADRYRLLALVATGGPADLWRAHDEVLARTVAVKAVPTPNRTARTEAKRFLDAAVRTGAVNAPGLARTYDATPVPRPGRGNDVACVIGEWVEGEPLDAHLERVGPVAALDAADVVRQAADALTAAHAAGLAHGRLHPRNVLVTATGRVRLTDTLVAATLHEDGPGSVEADTRDLGAVLHALLTGRWPAGATPLPGGSLSPTPREGTHLLSARQQRAGVPRELDSVVTRALEPSRAPTVGRLTTPAAFADAVDAAVAPLRAAQAQEEEESGPPGPPSRWRRLLPWAVATAVVTVVAVLGWTLGLAVGDLPPRAGSEPIAAATAAAVGGKVYPPVPLGRVGIRDFDPFGADHQENPGQVRNAVDDEPTTAWATQAYKSADFSGLKPGVGLLLDLRTRRDVHTVTVALTAAGADVELRVSDAPPATSDRMSLVAASKGKQVAVLRPPAGTAGRYVLVWVTKLPRDGKAFRVGISELRLT